MECRISRSLLERIVRDSALVAPDEGCGLLFGDADAITAAQVVRNVAEDRTQQFEIDPAALFAALRAERAGGPKLMGYWHSHPSGDPSPSFMDAAMAPPDGKLWLIVAGSEAKLWRAVEDGPVFGRFEQIPIV